MMLPRLHRRRVLVAGGAAGALTMAALASADVVGLRINDTPSMPRGLWQVVSDKAPLRRGEVVTVCPPDIQPIRAAIFRPDVAPVAMSPW
jgi:type IV secretory pathway protease TraF